ncbi:MAG: hypothetical protein V4736_06335 [Bdellovibrionota bacterium]
MASAPVNKLLKDLFPNEKIELCSDPSAPVPVPKANDQFLIAFESCDNSKAHNVRIVLFQQSTKGRKLIASGLISDILTFADHKLNEIVIEPRDTGINKESYVFTVRLQFKSLKAAASAEQLIVIQQQGSQIKSIANGPVESSEGKAFLIITKTKSMGFSDIAIKSKNAILPLRWNGTNYRKMTKEDL